VGLPHITQSELADLRSDGIEPTDEEILWLVDLGRQVENPAGRVNYALAGVPIRCGNLVLWPASIASSEWFDEVACNLFHTRLMQTYCLAFALVNARNPEIAWDELTSYAECKRVINRFALRCRCTVPELNAAICRIIPAMEAVHPVMRRKQKRGPRGPGLVASLVATTGLQADYWERRPISFAEDCMLAVQMQKTDGGIAEGYEDMRYRDACNEFFMAADAIRKAHAQ